MKKLLCMALALVMVLSLSVAAFADDKTEVDAIKDAGVLTVALSPDFAPMEFVDSSKEGQDQYVGFDVTLAKYIAEYLGVKLEIQAMSFDACQTAVAMDAVDMSISGYSWTEARAENFELSDYYYAGENETEQVLLIRAADAEKFTKPEDFAGVDVGAQNASLQMMLVEEQLPDAKPYTVGEIGVGVMELQSGNIDALAVASGNGEAIIVNNPDLVICSWQFDVKAEYEANVIMMHKGDTALLAVVNEALAQAYENGWYGEWYAEAKEMAGIETAVEFSFSSEADLPAEPEFDPNADYDVYTVVEYTIEDIQADLVCTVSANTDFTEFYLECNFYGDDQMTHSTYDGSEFTVLEDATGFMGGDTPAILSLALEQGIWVPIA